jgi:GTPase Era involved in 16S rRNA processing
MTTRTGETTRSGESARPELMIDLAAAADPITVDDVAARVTAIEGAIRAGGACLDPEAVANARVMVERTGERLQLGPRYTIVALVGATGSGKSTLFNALATMELAETGVKRPTTSRPMALVWGDASVHPLLDWLDISPRRRTLRETVLDADRERALRGLVLLDLPDHDSTHVTHRLEVDRLVELVDLLVWVVDPQKYGDEALHSGYLKRLVDHDGVMMVVLNQTDKLSPSEAATCRTDLRRLLDADRLQSVPILTTSALNGEGVDELRSVLADIVDVQDAVAQRVVADLDAAARRLRDGVADSEPDGTRLDGADDLVGTLAQAAGLPVVLDGVTAQHRRLGEQATGWPWLSWWRLLRGDNLSRLDLTGRLACPAGAGRRRRPGGHQLGGPAAAAAVGRGGACGCPPPRRRTGDRSRLGLGQGRSDGDLAPVVEAGRRPAVAARRGGGAGAAVVAGGRCRGPGTRRVRLDATPARSAGAGRAAGRRAGPGGRPRAGLASAGRSRGCAAAVARGLADARCRAGRRLGAGGRPRRRRAQRPPQRARAARRPSLTSAESLSPLPALGTELHSGPVPRAVRCHLVHSIRRAGRWRGRRRAGWSHWAARAPSADPTGR